MSENKQDYKYYHTADLFICLEAKSKKKNFESRILPDRAKIKQKLQEIIDISNELMDRVIEGESKNNIKTKPNAEIREKY